MMKGIDDEVKMNEDEIESRLVSCKICICEAESSKDGESHPKMLVGEVTEPSQKYSKCKVLRVFI